MDERSRLVGADGRPIAPAGSVPAPAGVPGLPRPEPAKQEPMRNFMVPIPDLINRLDDAEWMSAVIRAAKEKLTANGITEGPIMVHLVDPAVFPSGAVIPGSRELTAAPLGTPRPRSSGLNRQQRRARAARSRQRG